MSGISNSSGQRQVHIRLPVEVADMLKVEAIMEGYKDNVSGLLGDILAERYAEQLEKLAAKQK